MFDRLKSNSDTRKGFSAIKDELDEYELEAVLHIFEQYSNSNGEALLNLSLDLDSSQLEKARDAIAAQGLFECARRLMGVFQRGSLPGMI